MSIYIYLFIKQRPKSCYRRVGAHQRQRKREEGKKRKKSEEKERDRDTEGGPSKPIPSNRCAHREWRTERKTEAGNREKQGTGPQPSNPGPISRLLRRTGIKRWAYSFYFMLKLQSLVSTVEPQISNWETLVQIQS